MDRIGRFSEKLSPLGLFLLSLQSLGGVFVKLARHRCRATLV
jgi:hypothetical protein